MCDSWEGNKEVKIVRKSDFKNLLCGLVDVKGRFLGLGVIEEIDFTLRKLVIYTRVERDKIAAIQMGSIKVNRDGIEEGWVGSWRL